MQTRPKIAYLCDFSPLDTNSYSGGNNRIYTALERHVGDVDVLDNGWGLAEPVRRLMHATPEAINLRLRWRMHLVLSRMIARHVHRQLMQGRHDILFCAYSFQSLMNIRVPAGMVSAFTADATPTTYKRSEVGQNFGSYMRLSRLFDPWILKAEQKVFRKTDLLLWPTDWLKSGADSLYGLRDEQSHVVPWGANIDAPPRMELHPVLGRDHPVRLVMIGRDFFAKGGALVVSTVDALRNRGFDATLDVIGGAPPEAFQRDGMILHGHLNKAIPEEFAQFQRVLSQAHFLVQPSFESYGFAFCEAAAYGLPSLCLRVGGVPVRDGVSGHALPKGSSAENFADQIVHYLDRPDAYRELRKNARAEYEARLNWDAWGQSVSAILERTLAR